MNIDSTFTCKGRERKISINSDSSNRINESISKHKYMRPFGDCYYYFLIINNYRHCNEVNQHRLENNIYQEIN